MNRDEFKRKIREMNDDKLTVTTTSVIFRKPTADHLYRVPYEANKTSRILTLTFDDGGFDEDDDEFDAD